MWSRIATVGFLLLAAACTPDQGPQMPPDQPPGGEPPAQQPPGQQTPTQQPPEPQTPPGQPPGSPSPPGAAGAIDTTSVPTFGELDRDSDGAVTHMEAEHAPQLKEIFALSDSNQDGRLDVAEYSKATTEGMRASAGAARGPLFPALDMDENGRLSPEEARAVPQLAERFDAFDMDRSGGLDVGEYDRALEQGVGH